ncbi:Imm32 family immunity protein [Deinococcus maricopensis]|uniref:Imm32 family immunity protein n=1 Tax=Deinococcus maricopensis TaxID=309887 RepID=UPI003CCB2D73
MHLQANNAGLRSLVRLLVGLGVQEGHHWHLEDLTNLEEDSGPLTISKLPDL